MLRFLTVSIFLLTACGAADFESHSNSKSGTAKQLSFDLVSTMTHRRQAFTQGLLLGDNNTLFESSGNYGESHLVRMQAGSGHLVSARTDLPRHLFAEGLAMHDGTLYLLSWKAGICVLYDPETLDTRGTLNYQGQGWGLSSNGKQLVMSNGSHQLSFRNPATFDIERTLNVSLNGRPLARLNELEWVNELIYANIWYEDIIVAIDPTTGQVVQQIDLSLLRSYEHKAADALNGIAYKPDTNTFLITGKYWSQIYEIKLKQE